MKNAVPIAGSPTLGRGPFPLLSNNKRRFVRFPAMCRVEYEVGNRSTFVFTQDLSLGGMQLRNIKGLALGDTVTFHLHLSEGGGKSVGIDGTVKRVSGTSAGVIFLRDQEEATNAVHTFIGQRLISRAADHASGSGGNAAQVADLAMYYCEIGRTDDALDLYRKSLQRRSHEFVLYEQMATLLLFRIEQGGSESWTLLAELETLIGRGLGQQKSRVLDSINQDLVSVRKTLAQKQVEEKRREKDALLKEVEAHAVRIKKDLEQQSLLAIKKGIAEKAKELEQEYQAKLAGKAVKAKLAAYEKDADQKMAELDREIKQRRAVIEREQQKIDRQLAKLEKQEQQLATARDKHANAERLLREREAVFDQAQGTAKVAHAATKKDHDQREQELKHREREVTLREGAVASLEQLTKLIEKLHASNTALHAYQTQAKTAPPRRPS